MISESSLRFCQPLHGVKVQMELFALLAIALLLANCSNKNTALAIFNGLSFTGWAIW
jgi:hypothetical protein